MFSKKFMLDWNNISVLWLAFSGYQVEVLRAIDPLFVLVGHRNAPFTLPVIKICVVVQWEFAVLIKINVGVSQFSILGESFHSNYWLVWSDYKTGKFFSCFPAHLYYGVWHAVVSSEFNHLKLGWTDHWSGWKKCNKIQYYDMRLINTLTITYLFVWLVS